MPKFGMCEIEARLFLEKTELCMVQNAELIRINRTTENKEAPIFGVILRNIVHTRIIDVCDYAARRNYETLRSGVIRGSRVELLARFVAGIIPMYSQIGHCSVSGACIAVNDRKTLYRNGTSCVFQDGADRKLELRGRDTADCGRVYNFKGLSRDPWPLSQTQRVARVIDSDFGDNERSDNSKRADKRKTCPYGCDPIQAMRGPNLARPEIFLGGLVLFLTGGYFSQRGTDRGLFCVKHIGFWLVMVVGGICVTGAGVPFILRLICPLL